MNPITSPIARATARSSIIERNPIVRLGFRLITTRYWLPRPDRILQRLFPDGNRFPGSLSFRRMTSSLPFNPPNSCRSKRRRVSRSLKCAPAVPKHREPTQERRCGPHCESALPHASLPIYTRFSGSDRASVIVGSCLALSVQIERRSSQYKIQVVRKRRDHTSTLAESSKCGLSRRRWSAHEQQNVQDTQ
jgi:hypothetical protein